MHKAQARPNNHHYFCEFGVGATRLDCFNTTLGWLKRQPSFVWGFGPPQRVTTEVLFPRSNGLDIRKFFQGTVLQEVDSTISSITTSGGGSSGNKAKKIRKNGKL